MKRTFLALVCGLVASFFLVACGSVESNTEEGNTSSSTNGDTTVTEESEGIVITTSFSILADVIENVVGDRGSVDYVVPIGEEPHEYEPVPSDFRKVSDSDVFYTNGMNLEEWLEKLVANVGDVPVVSLSDGVTPIPLTNDDGEDPHIWLDPQNVITMVNNLVEDLVERDPAGEETYRTNSEAYIAELEALHAWIEAEVSSIPEENRIIVISEDAFRYFGAAYGIETVGIWEINSHEEGTPGQINRVVDIIREQNIPAVFVETTVDKRYMETVSSNAGVEISGEVYTDAVGLDGSGAETYIKMMEHNVNTFVNGLK